MVPGVTRTGSWVVGSVSEHEKVSCNWGDVVVDDDLLVGIVVEGVSCVANLVILVTVHVVFEPGCFSDIGWSPNPGISLLSSCLRISPHLSTWSVNRPLRIWLSAAPAVRKPALAVTIDFAKVFRESVEVCFSCKFDRSFAILTQVFVSSFKV